MFEIKDGYKLESQTSESIKLFGTTKKVIDKQKIEQMYQVFT